MKKRLEELEKASLSPVGRGQGSRDKNQGAILKRWEETPGTNQGPKKPRLRSLSCVRPGSQPPQRQRSQSQPRQRSQSQQRQGGPQGGSTATLTGVSSLTSKNKGNNRRNKNVSYQPKHPTYCCGEGWRKDSHRIYGWYVVQTIPTITIQRSEQDITAVLDHMGSNRFHWHFLKKNNSLNNAVLLNDLFEEVNGFCLWG